MLVVRDTGGNSAQIIGMAYRDAGGLLVELVGGAVRDVDGTLKPFFGALGDAAPGEAGSITLDTGEVAGFRNSSNTIAITTNTVTVTVTGASGTPTYAWEVIDGGGASWTIYNGATASARFSAECPPDSVLIGTFRCLVTVDGQSAYSPTVTATVRNYGGGLL